MNEKKITLELTIPHLNAILGSLGKQPLESVIEVFNIIQQQVQPQVQQSGGPEGPLADKVVN